MCRLCITVTDYLHGMPRVLIVSCRSLPFRQWDFYGEQFEHQWGGAPHCRSNTDTERYCVLLSAHLHPDSLCFLSLITITFGAQSLEDLFCFNTTEPLPLRHCNYSTSRSFKVPCSLFAVIHSQLRTCVCWCIKGCVVMRFNAWIDKGSCMKTRGLIQKMSFALHGFRTIGFEAHLCYITKIKCFDHATSDISLKYRKNGYNLIRFTDKGIKLAVVVVEHPEWELTCLGGLCAHCYYQELIKKAKASINFQVKWF